MTASSRKDRHTIAIIGGGYAGVAAAIQLNALGMGGQVTLFDPRAAHQKITQWHKLARGKNAECYETAFSTLARRFNFHFVQRAVDVAAVLRNPEEALGNSFGAVIVAQGSHTPARPAGVVTFDDLRDSDERQKELMALRHARVAVIGGGPTGVQFSFELAERGNTVMLYEARERLLPSFDYALGSIAEDFANRAKIDVRFGSEFLRFENGEVISRSAGREQREKTDYVLFVPGVKSTPSVVCDLYGQVEGIQHKNLYAAGDNSYFSGRGLNSKSAQAAVRKGQHVARSIVARWNGRRAPEYTYQELGYFVSLGAQNAVGYLLSQKTAFSGRGALLMKEAIERQYNLYLEGLPVYP